jgi:hypothetical protein
MYSEVKTWWESHDGWASIPEALLPSTSFIIGDENKLYCVCFLYRDDSTKVAMMEWLVANPTNTPRESLQSIMLLLSSIARFADENKLVLFTTLQNDRLSKLYEKQGFVSGDKGMMNMTRIP